MAEIHKTKEQLQEQIQESKRLNIELHNAKHSHSPQVLKGVELPSDFTKWDTMHVKQWLEAKGFGNDVIDSFLSHSVTGTDLVDIGMEALKEEFAITAFGTRNKLIGCLRKLTNTLGTPELLQKQAVTIEKQTREIERLTSEIEHTDTTKIQEPPQSSVQQNDSLKETETKYKTEIQELKHQLELYKNSASPDGQNKLLEENQKQRETILQLEDQVIKLNQQLEAQKQKLRVQVQQLVEKFNMLKKNFAAQSKQPE